MLITRPVVEQLLAIDGEYGDKFRAVLTISWLGLDRVFLLGFHGVMSRAEYSEFYQQLRDKGVKHVHRVRHGEFQTQDI